MKKPGPPNEVRLIGGRPHEVRLIGGLWKRSKLPVAARPGLRPTPDRVRETLFNWLGQDLTGWRCLDAFAGSGALGFEAASRGAAQVVLVERDAVVVSTLRAVKERLHADAVRIEPGDGLIGLGRAGPASFDLVFLDPPYDAGLMAAALAAAAGVVVPGGYVYTEGAAPQLELPAGLAMHRQGRAGQVHFQLLRREPAGGA